MVQYVNTAQIKHVPPCQGDPGMSICTLYTSPTFTKATHYTIRYSLFVTQGERSKVQIHAILNCE